jgi:hypothetical protein
LKLITSLNKTYTLSKEFIDNAKKSLINLLVNLYNEKKCSCLIINDDFYGILTEEFIVYNSPFKKFIIQIIAIVMKIFPWVLLC